jgi:hypothetical protein
VQAAARQAARECGLEGVTPHRLRPAYATHALHKGAFVRDLQARLRHESLETTLRRETRRARVAAVRMSVIVPSRRRNHFPGPGGAEAERASFLRRKATQPGTCASLSPCSKSGPLNP